ncbi:DUF4434 domain-containing protein [Hafnia alvei]|nr:DUF4434 domain-containing protein [Hafnia alvei]
MNAIIYQPQLRDMSADKSQWRTLMDTLRDAGFDTLVLQWSEYGSAFSQGEEQQWLMDRARVAHDRGLHIVVGLHADPEFFTRQNQPVKALGNYLNRQRTQDVAVAQRWIDKFGSANIAGWYLTPELDDLRWRDETSRSVAVKWLTETKQSLLAVADKPVSISSFFAGNMTPDTYRDTVADFAATGVKIWVQDGAGVDKLSQRERSLYLNTTVGCEKTSPAAGEVFEIFRQIKGDKAFHAQPASAQEISSVLRQTSACGKDKLIFSLRYLPAAVGILAY